MSFDEILDLTADVFSFRNMLEEKQTWYKIRMVREGPSGRIFVSRAALTIRAQLACTTVLATGEQLPKAVWPTADLWRAAMRNARATPGSCLAHG